MGSILSQLGKSDNGSDTINLEEILPNGYSNAYANLYDQATDAVNRGEDSLRYLEKYSPTQEEIRIAIMNPNDIKAQERVVERIAPNIKSICRDYELSQELELIFPKLLMALKTPGAVQKQQALLKRLSDIIVFSTAYDHLKMRTPGLQNDFSYFKRSIVRMKTDGDQAIQQLMELVPDSKANFISLFIAEHCPMTSVLIRACHRVNQENASIRTVVASVANICCNILSQKTYQKDFMVLYCKRAMTGAIVIYDHISSTGAFQRTAQVKIKPCLKELSHNIDEKVDVSNQLKDYIKYTGKHFNDSTTPKSIKALLVHDE